MPKPAGFSTAIEEQSQDIAIGIDEGSGLHTEQGAGDQGTMFGYACSETKELMPATISYAHKLLHRLATARRSGDVNFLRPDAKSQVTARYRGDELEAIDSVVVSTQHSPEISHGDLKDYVIEECIRKEIPEQLLSADTSFFVNPTGRFVVGGPQGDCGLTGRKIIVDTYGGHGSHGGGAFSGKDPTKVDRSASYYARYIAKNLVAAGACRKCLVQLSYVIGVSRARFCFCGDLWHMQSKGFRPRPTGTRIVPAKTKRNHHEPRLASSYLSGNGFLWPFRARKNFLGERTDKVDEIKARLSA